MTLDEDVFERLKQETRARGVPFRQTINDVLRSGLLASPPTVPEFRVEAKGMGLREGLSYDSVPAVLEFGEGDDHR